MFDNAKYLLVCVALFSLCTACGGKTSYVNENNKLSDVFIYDNDLSVETPIIDKITKKNDGLVVCFMKRIIIPQKQFEEYEIKRIAKTSPEYGHYLNPGTYLASPVLIGLGLFNSKLRETYVGSSHEVSSSKKLKNGRLTGETKTEIQPLLFHPIKLWLNETLVRTYKTDGSGCVVIPIRKLTLQLPNWPQTLKVDLSTDIQGEFVHTHKTNSYGD